MGGGMRQSGYLAAAGLYALDHHVQRLGEDHARARILERELKALPYVAEVLPVSTNIVIFRLQDSVSTEALLQNMRENGIRALSTGRQTIRCVFHLQVDDAQLEVLVATLRGFG